jgi:hypothetical protein
MKHDFVQEVVSLALVSGAAEAPTASDWQRAEADIGLQLPPDFKALVSTLGTGSFGVGLILRNPLAESEYIQLSKRALTQYAMVVTPSATRSNLTLYPRKEGLVHVAGIDRQALLVRPFGLQEPTAQITWWDADFHRAQELPMTLSQLLHDLYLGRSKAAWAARLRGYIWRDSGAPFFTPWRKQ